MAVPSRTRRITGISTTGDRVSGTEQPRCAAGSAAVDTVICLGGTHHAQKIWATMGVRRVAGNHTRPVKQRTHATTRHAGYRSGT